MLAMVQRGEQAQGCEKKKKKEQSKGGER